MPDWRQPRDYADTDTLNGTGWAWEFLRRNSRYRREWQAFIETWRALEADHGRAPNRDYPSWKNDPRAHVFEPPRQDGESIAAWEARTGNDCVAIECAFGARWGLYKFPPDPARSALELGDTLAFRDQPRLARVVGADSDYLGQQHTRIALGFDLDLPLKDQLEEARRFLIARQHHLRRDQAMPMRGIASQREAWRAGLRVLDALEAGASADEIARQLFAGDRDAYSAHLHQALALHDRDYRELPALGA